MRKNSLLSLYLVTALASGVGARLTLNRVDLDVLELGRPLPIGRLNGANIAVHLGDVAIPNRLTPTAGEPDKLALDSRLLFWDAYLLTAPVPRIVSTETGAILQVPWTLLPASAVSTVEQLDSVFAERLEDWLQLKQSSAEWHFERLDHMDVPSDSRYYQTTALRRIYAINMFEFVRELGGDYQENLTRAISSAVKEVAEESGNRGDQRLAIPGLAAAEHVIDRDLVVSYADSFGAILDGISRAAKTPSEVVLVIWHRWSGTPELASALNGLSAASYDRIPGWSERLKVVSATAAAAGLLTGILCAFVTTKRRRRSDRFTFIIGVIAVVPTVAGYWYLDALLKIAPLSRWPAVEVGLLALASCGIGHVLQRKGALEFGKADTPRP